MAFYAAVSFLSALLLFLVQPLIAKAILPWFGGAPAVWTTCLLFFQSALLAGYAWAHWSTKRDDQRQARIHLALLLLTLLTLPILPSASWKPTGEESPVWRILGLLVVTVGAPYLMLASTAPLLQRWFSRETTRPPYRLYAWSNAGSLVGLLGYPFVFERVFSVPQQARAWSVAYVAFVAACGAIAWRAARIASQIPAEESEEATAPSGALRLLWFALAAGGSGLLMAITNQLTLDIASVPFLWVLPLALYLLTFIIAFAGYYRRAIWRPAFILGLGAMVLLSREGAGASLPAQIAGLSFALFAGCMICHGELVRLIPDHRRLTSFYLIIAAGGAAGGILVGLIAPLVFPDFWELPIFLLLPYLLMTAALVWESPTTRRPITAVATGAVLWLGVAAFLIPRLRDHSETPVASSRNFYGVLHVVDDHDSLPQRHLRNGRITHGTQFLDAAHRDLPTAYYSEGSGVELAIDHHPRREAGPLAVGAIGLGVGTIAIYGRSGDHFRFFEINPAVERLARRHFTFLADTRASVDVVMGDGRLSLEREVARGDTAARYDVLVLDAFAGDAIPVHLLTEEAVRLYWKALRPDGILAIHTSNRHLDLSRVVSGLAPGVRKRIVRIRRSSGFAALGSTWILMTSNTDFLRWVANNVQYGVDVPAEPPVIWTDAFSNLYEVLGGEKS